MEIIRSIASFAFAAVSAGTVMTCLFSLSASNTFSSVIIFMNGQTASGLAATKRFSGFCFCIW